MNGVRYIIRHAAQTHVPKCSNETCSARSWQLWVRRGNGIRVNSNWYCSEQCAGAAIDALLASVPRFGADHPPTVHRLPLGLLMLSRGVIDEEQLKAAVMAQVQHPELKIGRCLETLGAVTTDEVTRALGAQHCVPVLLAFRPEVDHSLPLRLLESSRCVAFRGNYHPELLYLGFESKVDRSLLRAGELMLGCACEACIVDSRIVEQHLQTRREARRVDEITFDARFSTAEIAQSISSYAQQVRADEVRIASTRDYLWAKVSGAREVDLLFRRQ